jgi:hypothetical protein
VLGSLLLSEESRTYQSWKKFSQSSSKLYGLTLGKDCLLPKTIEVFRNYFKFWII